MAREPRTPAPDGRARRWEGQRAVRRAELVEAAMAAIAEHGPEITTEQIAAEAGVPRPALYRHFTGGDDLQRAIAERALQLYTEVLMTPVWNPPSGTPQDMLTAAITGHVRWIAEHPDLYRYVLRAAHATSAVTDLRQSITNRLIDLLTSDTRGARLDLAVAEPLAAGAVGLVDAATARWLNSSNPMSLDELVEDLARWVWAALDAAFRPRAGPDRRAPP